MPRAIDVVGRETSDEAQRIYDSALLTDNLAGHKQVAERAAKHFEAFFREAETGRTELNNKLTTLYSLWNGDPLSYYVSSLRSVHVPEPYKAVEGLVPRMIDILTGQPDWFRVTGVDEDGKRHAETISLLLKQQLRLDDFTRKLPLFVRDDAIYGWAPAKVYWKFRRRNIRYTAVHEEPAIQGGIQAGKMLNTAEKNAVINMDGPTVEPIDHFHFHVNLRYRDIQGLAPGVAFSQEITEAELLEYGRREAFMNVQDLIKQEHRRAITESRSPATSMDPSLWREIRNYSDGLHSVPYGFTQPTRRYEIWEYWGRFDPSADPTLQKTGTEDEYCIIMGQKMEQRSQPTGWIPLRIAKNGYWHGRRPAVVAHFTRRSHCFQSKGLIEPIVRLCRELDDLRNMSLAAAALAAKPVMIADDSLDFAGPNLVLDAGTLLRGRTTEGIKPVHVPDRSESSYRSEMAIKQDIRETTAIIRLLAGSEGEKGETATGTVSRIREANKRIAEPARSFAQEFLVPMLEMFHAMNQQMITEDRLIELIGPDGLVADIRKIGPEDIAGRVHIEITTLPQLEMAGIKSQSIVNFLTAAGPWAQMQPGIIDPEWLLRKAWIEMHGTGDVDKAFPMAGKPKRILSSADEHELIGNGHTPQVQEGEDHEVHLRGHLQFVKTWVFPKWPPDSKRKLIAHIENTKRAMVRKLEQETIPQMLHPAPMQAMGQQPMGQQPMQQQPAGTTGMVRSQMARMEPRTRGMEL